MSTEKLLKDWNSSETVNEAFLRNYRGCSCQPYSGCTCTEKARKSFMARMSRIRRKLIKQHGHDWTDYMKVEKRRLEYI